MSTGLVHPGANVASLCVCVRERERGREHEKESERDGVLFKL